jgi:TonB family protein
MAAVSRQNILRAYECYEETAAPLMERLFKIVLGLTVGLFVVCGLFLRTIPPKVIDLARQITSVKAQFVMPVEKAPVVKQKVAPVTPKKEEAALPKEPIDLTQNPVLGQKTDDIHPASDAPRARAVYGLRRVYSYGIGAGGNLGQAVIGKLGNTLKKDVDTFSVTREELKGEVVSTTTITAAPKFRKTVKPEYTAEMLANRLEGVIKVKVLVDIDGKVKKAIVLNDLGFGSGDQALKACLEMEFEPALRGDQPVAVWIIIPIRFVMLG